MHLPLIILTDDLVWAKLLPYTYTRSVADIRVGILTIKEKWELHLRQTAFVRTQPYLQSLYPSHELQGSAIYINAAVLPDESLAENIQGLLPGEMLHDGSQPIAWYVGGKFTQLEHFNKILYSERVNVITSWCSIFEYNAGEIRNDFFKVTINKKSQHLSIGNTLLGNPAHLFIDEGAKVHASVINVTDGPIYVGRNAEIMEGSLLRGPISLGDDAVIRMGAKIYPSTSIGPHCKIGGEINNCIFHSYTNKAHDGFMGNSVIGSWCNIGADTNNSNLKNNYGEIEIWDYNTSSYINSGKQFCGVLMADHVKTGINTMINTGTVIGPCSNVFGAGFTKKNIPAYSWGGIDETTEYDFDKAMETIHRMMLRRHISLKDSEKDVLKKIFEDTVHHRISNQ